MSHKSPFLFDRKKGLKQCGYCLKVRPVPDFDRNTRNPTGYQFSCKLCTREAVRQWRRDHREEYLENKRDKFTLKRHQAKIAVIHHYSKGANKCGCCGEDEILFLSIDHVDGGGRAHRKAIGSKYFFIHLVTAGFPKTPKLQVWCFNCNMAKGFYGFCPHKRRPK